MRPWHFLMTSTSLTRDFSTSSLTRSMPWRFSRFIRHSSEMCRGLAVSASAFSQVRLYSYKGLKSALLGYTWTSLPVLLGASVLGHFGELRTFDVKLYTLLYLSKKTTRTLTTRTTRTTRTSTWLNPCMPLKTFELERFFIKFPDQKSINWKRILTQKTIRFLAFQESKSRTLNSF